VAARRAALTAGCALSLLALVTATIPVVVAQEATPPAATPVAQEAATPAPATTVARPVHIHSGDCVNLGEVVYPLNDLTRPVGEPAGQADKATPVESSFTVVPVTLAELLAGNYAINVHLSAAEIGTYLACGELGGVVDANGALIIGLREQSNSGYTGIAYLIPDPNGVSTDVSVFIAPVFGAAG
jgi:hypothetical protein